MLRTEYLNILTKSHMADTKNAQLPKIIVSRSCRHCFDSSFYLPDTATESI